MVPGMTQCEIIIALEAPVLPPSSVIRAASDYPEAIAPQVIALIEKAGRGALLTPRQQRLMRRGLHVLAAARSTSVWKPLLRLLRRSRDELDRCLGLAVTETLPSVSLATFDGDADSLLVAIADRQIDGYVRWALLGTMARLTFDGTIARNIAVTVLESFEREAWADTGDAAWEGWQEAVRLLGLVELADHVRATWSDGRNSQRDVDRQVWEDELAAACAEPANAQRFITDRLQPLADAVTVLASLEGNRTPEQCSTEKPKFDELNEEEIDWLHDCLRHSHAAINVEQLDGFCTALAVSPVAVSTRDVVAEIWSDAMPAFDDAQQADFTIDLIERHRRSIARRLETYRPLATIMADAELPANDWADGFMRGVTMRMEVWDRRLPQDEQLSSFLSHIMMLAVNAEVAEADGITKDERAKMVDSLSLAVLGLFVYWRERPLGKPSVPQATRRGPNKNGRNAPCHCGSGKKFKRCCGAAGLTIH